MNDSSPKPSPRPRRRGLRIVGALFCVLVLAVGVVAATFSPSWLLTPSSPFDPAKVPPPPSYADPASWAALPSVTDHADLVVGGDSAAGPNAAADVFYVHPTTYFSKAGWNAAIDEPVSRELLDEVVLAAEASVFNGCCRVFAPRYRQATLGTFYADPSDARQALGLAYTDVEAAFEAFLDRTGDRPFILAGHSQGSMHLLRLLGRIDREPELRERLVVAYVPGFAVPRSQYGEAWQHLVPCDGPVQVGCVAAWDLYREGATVGGAEPLFHWRGEALVKIPVEERRQCTNPVSWRDGGSADAETHLGGVTPQHRGDPPSFVSLLMASAPLGLRIAGLTAHPQARVRSRCEGDVLRVPDLGSLGFPEQETEPGNYHLHDYELFHADVRANAIARVRAFVPLSGD